ncbi:PH domain-containing protein [Tumidithrix helvetica PCC 7403]|uniref:PH domain-containing protein n=1 Tax=Tumidithrix helvetica TaxID=3457545 RepID=UPI003C8D2130
MASDPPRTTSEEQVFFKGRPAAIGSVGRLFLSIITLGIAWLWFWLKNINTHYLITSQRIVIETGIFSQKIDTIELYLIDDIQLEKPFSQRLMGTGNMLLVTQDISTPKVYLERLPLDVRQLYELIRPYIQKGRQRYRMHNDEDFDRRS